MPKQPLLCLTCMALLLACQSPTVQRRPDSKKLAFDKQVRDWANRKNWYTHDLIGRVKSIIEITYSGDVKDTLAPGYASKNYLFFDEKGNLVKRLVYDKDLSPYEINIEFDPTGRWTSMLYCTLEGIETRKEYHIYDNRRRLIEEGQVTSHQDTTHLSKYTYDQYDGLIQQRFSKSVLDFKNSYDEDSILVQQDGFSNKRYIGKQVWELDSIGHRISETIYDEKGNMMSSEKRLFNDKHDLTMLAVKDNKKPETIKQMEYDSHGNVTKQAYIDPSNGQTTEITLFDYQYDTTGNWIKRSLRKEGQAITGTKIRIITYY